VISAKLNSPPCASTRPVRTALRRSGDEGHGQPEDQAGVVPDQRQVQSHAHRDEEKAEEQVAERPDVGFDLVTVLRLREHDAGEECPERSRQAGAFGGVGRGEHHQENGQRKQFCGSGAGDFVEQGTQQPVAGEEDDGEDDDGLAKPGGDFRQPRGGVAREHRDQGKEQHDGHVLEQQDGDGGGTVGLLDFQLLRQLAGDEGRG
jgi:hypothetical protein